jgi:hypothetical protein
MARAPASPDFSVYLPSPRNHRQPVSGTDAPGYGGNGPQMYSVGADAPTGGPSMWVQPAFVVSEPNGTRHTPPDPGLELWFGPKPRVPTFFPVGNRAANSNSNPSGVQESVRMLALPPDRYNALANVRRTRKDVRDGLLRNRPSKSRAAGPAMGG